ncbi:24384_t:CDS:2 [Cetraspora pellucida]|uniref:24384_t:CDS:1 n=1 Tax=Cetraspora pellucida TaxID=1433469 RepID=A0A9N8VY16_9GLOM|nr:24384_t:CDS:2 [Cetraspora pellucida]
MSSKEVTKEDTKDQLPINRNSVHPLNVKGAYPTGILSSGPILRCTKQTPQKGGLGQKVQEQEIGHGFIPKKRGSKMREEKEFEELSQEAEKY